MPVSWRHLRPLRRRRRRPRPLRLPRHTHPGRSVLTLIKYERQAVPTTAIVFMMVTQIFLLSLFGRQLARQTSGIRLRLMAESPAHSNLSSLPPGTMTSSTQVSALRALLHYPITRTEHTHVQVGITTQQVAACSSPSTSGGTGGK